MKTSVLCVVLIIAPVALARSSEVIRSNTAACPLPDPFESPSGGLVINLKPICETNEGSERGHMLVHGLKTVNVTFDVNMITLNAPFDFKLETIKIHCKDFKVNGWVDARPIRQETLPSGNLTGTGDAKITADNVHVNGIAKLFINLIGNKVSILRLTLNIVSFDSVTFDLGPDYLVDGKPIDWATLSKDFKPNFDQDFAQHKSEITEKIRNAVNPHVQEYTLSELINLIGNGGGECPTDPHP